MSANSKSKVKKNVLCEIEVVYTPLRKDVPRKKISSSIDAFDLFREIYNPKTICFRESAYVLYLDRANHVLGFFHLSIGSTAGTIFDLKHILAIALKTNSSGIIVSHNHPSGNLKPSQSDLSITNKLREACKIMEIQLLDHLIMTSESYYSMADEGDI
jgi:DNA repair protein RadC